MQPLPDHRDLSAAGCIIQGCVVGELLRQSLKPRRNITWQRNLRSSSQLALHEAVKAFIAALKIAETAVHLQRQRLLQWSDPHQKPLKSLIIQAGGQLS